MIDLLGARHCLTRCFPFPFALEGRVMNARFLSLRFVDHLHVVAGVASCQPRRRRGRVEYDPFSLDGGPSSYLLGDDSTVVYVLGGRVRPSSRTRAFILCVDSERRRRRPCFCRLLHIRCSVSAGDEFGPVRLLLVWSRWSSISGVSGEADSAHRLSEFSCRFRQSRDGRSGQLASGGSGGTAGSAIRSRLSICL